MDPLSRPKCRGGKRREKKGMTCFVTFLEMLLVHRFLNINEPLFLHSNGYCGWIMKSSREIKSMETTSKDE